MPLRPHYVHQLVPADVFPLVTADLPLCPECKTGELNRYLDRPTQVEELVCLECGHVVPGPPPIASTELPMSISDSRRASPDTSPPLAKEAGEHPGKPAGTYAGVVLAARAFAIAALGDRWRRVEVVVIGHHGLPALTVTTHRRD